MYDLLTYSLKAAFVLALLYVPYSLLLRKERFFRLNRLMLLLILTLSLLLPLCNISLPAVSEPAIQAFEQQKETIETLFVMHTADQTESTQQIQTAINEEQSPFDKMLYWVAIVNLAGIAFMFLLRLWQFINMERLIRCGALWKDKQDGGITIYCHSDNVKPCSWMRSIVISEQDYANHRHEILLHEKGHIIHHHSLDILLLTFVQLTQWWNPFIYMLSASLRDVHEYEADNYVLRQGVSMYEYQSLLLKTAVGSSSYAFANSFNHSLLKKRFTMMLNKKSNPWMRSKALYILPVAVIALSAFATPEFNNHANAGIEVINSGKVTENSGSTKVLAEKSVYAGEEEDDKVFIICEEMPEYVGGSAKMMEMLMKNMKYPAIAQEHGVQGQIIVGFIVEKDGSCSNFEIKRNSAAEKTEGATVNAYARPDSIVANAANIQKAKKALEEEAIRVCKLMKFTPGKQRGMVVRTQFSIPLTFRLQ